MVGTKYVWSFLRITLGLIFLWSFFDKLFGFGFSTVSSKAWIEGISPTFGFLTYASKGPVAGFFKVIAGNIFVDWLFMTGLFLIGIALVLGIGIKIASYAGALLMFLFWLVVLPKEHNPIIDEHVLYFFIFIGLANIKEHWFSFNRRWRNITIVKKYGFLV